MKLLRLWLLVMLAVLLPVRGALAATMPCGPASLGGHGGLHGTGAHAGHGHQAEGVHLQAEGQWHQAEVQEHQAEGQQHQADGHDPAHHPGHHGAHHDQTSQDRCSLCSACCSSASLPSTPMAVDAPMATASVAFPGFSAPSPTFQSDGLERPPRSA